MPSFSTSCMLSAVFIGAVGCAGSPTDPLPSEPSHGARSDEAEGCVGCIPHFYLADSGVAPGSPSTGFPGDPLDTSPWVPNGDRLH